MAVDTGEAAVRTADALAQLSRSGLRRMPSRVMIIERLAAVDGHLSAAEIHRGRGRDYDGVHLGTVHRGLDTLHRTGLIHSVDDHGTQKFGLINRPHLHALCESCGTMVEVSSAGLEPVITRLADQAGFVVAVDGVMLRGRCRDCAC